MVTVNAVYAQNYIITGRVVDLDGNPVNGAVVRANKSKIEAKTSEDGVYVIKLSPDDRKLRVYYNDVLHKWQRVSVKDTTDGVTLKINTAPVVEMV